MKLKREDVVTFVLMLIILSIGGMIRGISLFTNGSGVLLDLDPFHILRAVEAIVSNGFLPKFDSLSAAPFGTTNTYATSQGYYYLISEIAILSGTSPKETLAISPLIFYLIELILLFSITYSLTHSRAGSLLTSFFAVCFKGWSAISVLGGDPVAENLGVVTFLVVILLVTIYYESSSFLVVGLLSFIDGISVEIHPVTFYFTNLVLLAVILALIFQKAWIKARNLTIGVLFSTYGIALVSIAGAKVFSSSGEFSYGALWLASLKPFVFTINNGIILSEEGIVTLVLAGLSIILVMHYRVKKDYFVIGWAGILYLVVLIGLLSVWTPYVSLVEKIPFYAPLVLSQRIMPYFPPALAVLAGLFVGEFLEPELIKIQKDVSKIVSVVAMIIVLFSIPQLVSAYQYTTSYSTVENNAYFPNYVSLYQWIDKNTGNHSVFAVNDLGFGEYIKAIVERPVVFTTSEEDLAVPDLNARANLQTCLFLNVCSNNETLYLISKYQVDYAIVINPAMLVDQNVSSFVYFNDNPTAMHSYLSWFSSRPQFMLEYNNSAVFVFKV